MNDYIEVRYDLDPCDSTRTDILAAILAERGFESFVPDDTGVTAYIRECDFCADKHANADIASELMLPTTARVTATRVEGRDWNAEWERNYFQPIVVGDQCVIHSSFHTDIPKCTYDITIDPKMAFGTGHHATTSLILERLLAMPLEGVGLIDVGTGTGILALLAAMRGASPVTGIEIDEFAYVNAVENVASNGHPEISIVLGDASKLDAVKPAEIVLANINRNVILADMHRYVRCLLPAGTMILSGFYIDDVELIEAEAAKWGLQPESVTERDRWACVSLRKESR